MSKNKVTLSAFARRKRNGEKLVMLTSYDAPTAAIASAAGIDIILVGDSVAMAQLGYANTIPVTMEDMIHHTKAVRRGAPDSFVVFDMPFMSYQASDEEALRNAGRALKETGADAVKLEGGAEVAPLIKKLVSSGIPVMAHLGLLPQHVQAVGGYKITGRGNDAERLVNDALTIQEAGAFSVVLECMISDVAREITSKLDIPTIGIGSGPDCDGQVQVVTDILGIGDFLPKHAKRFANIGEIMKEAMKQYAEDTKSGTFPTQANSFTE